MSAWQHLQHRRTNSTVWGSALAAHSRVSVHSRADCVWDTWDRHSQEYGDTYWLPYLGLRRTFSAVCWAEG